jgi:hypothetical protein
LVYLKKDTIQQMMEVLSPQDEGEEKSNRKREGLRRSGSCLDRKEQKGKEVPVRSFQVEHLLR